MSGRKRVLSAILLFVLLAASVSGAAAKTSYASVTINGLTYLLSNTESYYAPKIIEGQAESLYKGLKDHPEVKSYVYLVNSSRSVDIRKDVTAVPPMYEIIRSCFSGSETDYLRLGSLEEYGRYFYTTDHHWNYRGSYAGYCQIVRMLLGEEEPVLEPAETVVFPVKFNGSLNQMSGRKDSKEDFTVYRFDYPEMKISINGKPANKYGNQEAYFAGRYSSSTYANHYNSFYGGEEGLIHVETGREDRGNLLVFSNSQSDAVNLLLASHFRNTWIVDLKHYKDHMHKPFHLGQAVTDWNIDQVLIIGDGMYFKAEYRYH